MAIIGPTAVGKSALALKLAVELKGEIVNADSRQVYRYMDIGTGKPTPSQRAMVPHHLYDIVDPDEDFNLASYKVLAYAKINEIQARGSVPLLVGGSGLYVWSTIENWTIPEVSPAPELRLNLEAQAEASGPASLHDQLRRIDPVAAAKIAPENVRRTIRALEVYRATGRPPSSFWRKGPPPFVTFICGLTMKRTALYQTINRRVDNMVTLGLVDEVKRLLGFGYTPNLPAMSGIGYREIVSYHKGDLELASAIERVKTQTHRYARRQYAWFKMGDSRIHWFDAQSDLDLVCATVREFLETAPCLGG